MGEAFQKSHPAMVEVDFAALLTKALAETDDEKWIAAADARVDDRKEPDMLSTEQLRKIDLTALEGISASLAKRRAIEDIRALDMIHKAARKDLDDGTTLFNEREATDLWTDHAVGKWPKLGKAQAFAKLCAEDRLPMQHIEFCKIAGWNASAQKVQAAGDGVSSAGQPVRGEGGRGSFDVNDPEVEQIRNVKPWLTIGQAIAEAEGRRREVERMKRRGGSYGRSATLQRV
jgi:hypothetical protein